jgi:hypothetical protein
MYWLPVVMSRLRKRDDLSKIRQAKRPVLGDLHHSDERAAIPAQHGPGDSPDAPTAWAALLKAGLGYPGSECRIHRDASGLQLSTFPIC